MLKLALIGEGIRQSQSPDLHRRLGRLAQRDTRYDLCDALDIPDFSFPDTVARLRDEGYQGVNVTYPFKEAALKLADHGSESVRRVGSSNTLIFEAHGIRAENTDYTGFISAYRHRFQTRAAGNVLMLGAGGVGRAVGCALGSLNLTRLSIVERDPARGEALSRSLNDQGIPAETLDSRQAQARLPAFDGLVNCTPVGHRNHPGCPIDTAPLRAGQWVFDAVYVPAVTELLGDAQSRGADTLSGVDLFVFQGIDAFRLFADSDAVNARIDAHILEIRDHYFNRLVKTEDPK